MSCETDDVVVVPMSVSGAHIFKCIVDIRYRQEQNAVWFLPLLEEPVQ